MSDNKIQAVDLYRQGAEKGDPQGQFKYGRCLMMGIGVTTNTAEAEKWLRMAANSGHAEAAQLLQQLRNVQPTPSTTTTASTQPEQAEVSGMGCAVIAAIIVVGMIILASVPTGEKTSLTKIFGIAITLAMAYALRNSKK